jgi:adenosine deaminase
VEPHVAQRLLAAMPKAELHLHLDGSLRVETALELARARGIDAPRDYDGMFAALCPGKRRLASQAELLRSFELPVALLQDAEALERATRELVESKLADNVRYLEIKWAPALHTTRGLSLDDVVAAVASGAKAPGAVVSLTAVAVRSHHPAANVEVALAAERGEVDGFDLAGLEAEFPDPREHRRAFEAARAGGLHITIHAGEIDDDGASVRHALELKPERIAHGVSAANDAELCAELIERRITLDLCPTSNVQAASVESLEQHPIARLHRQRVPVSLSTDDATISDVTLSEELLAAHTVIGLTLPELWQMNLHALQVGFGDERRRAALHAEFVQWGSIVPELVGPPA